MRLDESGATGAEVPPLSKRQRRDLLELAAAGVMSAVFVAAPLVVARHSPGYGVRQGGQTVQVTSPVAAAARPAASTASEVHIVTTDIPATVSVPPLIAVRAVVPAVRRGAPQRRPHATLASARRKQPLGRRLVRLFAGDGTHTVQPFPTLPATER